MEITLHEILALVLFGSGMFSLGINAGKYLYKKDYGNEKVLKFLWRYVGVLYFPIYLLAWVLHKIARLVLAIAYFGLLNKQAGKDIIKSLFKWHGRY